MDADLGGGAAARSGARPVAAALQWGVLLWLLAACHPLGTVPDPGSDPAGDPRVTVTPAALDFGAVSVDGVGSWTLSFTVHNLADEAVTVTGHDEPLGADPFQVDAEPLLVVPAGGEVAVPVTFTPRTDGGSEATLIVEPGGETVALVGRGTAPVLTVGEVAFDPVVLGCTGEGTLAVGNAGSEALAFLDATVTGEGFAVVGWPDSVPPAGDDLVRLAFTPSAGGSRGGVLTLTTSDPLTPQVAVTVSVLGYEGERVDESFTYTPANPTDILLLVDGGTPHDPDRVQDGLAVFVDTLRGSNIDYQVAAVDSGSPCPDGAPAFATRSDTSLRTEATLRRGFEGPGGGWDDDLLALADEALGRAGAGGCLEGFRRVGADLHLVAVSDGPSVGVVEDQVIDLATTWGRLRLSALVPADPACGAVDPAWSAAAATTGGSAHDLCAADWSAAFTAFATLPPGADPVTYPLAEVPVPSTIAVTVEGQPFAAWRYDAGANAVVFDGDAVPAFGSAVEITYVLAVACG